MFSNNGLNHSISTGRRVVSSAVSQRLLQRDGVHRRNGSHRQGRAEPTTLLITAGRRAPPISGLHHTQKVSLIQCLTQWSQPCAAVRKVIVWWGQVCIQILDGLLLFSILLLGESQMIVKTMQVVQFCSIQVQIPLIEVNNRESQ